MVSVRKAKKRAEAENKLKKQDLSLTEALDFVDKIYNNPDAIIDWRALDKALRIIGESDSRFAADMQKDLKLREAYQIAGGYYHRYKSVTDEKRFNNAIKLVEADDPEFAQALKDLHDNGVSFKNATTNDLATAEQIFQNARDLSIIATDSDVINDVCADEEIQEGFTNTPVVDEDVSQEEANNTIVGASVNDAVVSLGDSAAFAEANQEEKRSMFMTKLKKAIKWNLIKTRLDSVGKSISGIKNAFNLKKNIPVWKKSIAKCFQNSSERFTSFIKNLSNSKAAAWFNKTRMKVALAGAATVLMTAAGCSIFNKGEVRSSEPAPRHTNTNGVMPSAAVVTAAVAPTDSVRAEKTSSLHTASVTTDSTTVSNDAKPVWQFNDSIAPTVAVVEEISTATDSLGAAKTSTINWSFNEQTDSTVTVVSDASAFIATTPVAETDSVKIVADSDSIPFGTPAAGYVAERGGYENRGVGSKNKYMRLRNKVNSTWANELGVNAYDLIVEHINDHPEVFRSKGTIGEGWTADQILQSYVTLLGASGQTRQSSDVRAELQILGRLINPRGCDMSVTHEQMQAINGALAQSNTDNMRDGVLYNLPKAMTGVTLDRCEQKVNITVVETNQTNITPRRTSGTKHPEFYMLPIVRPVNNEPVFTRFNDVQGDTIVNIVYTDSLVAPQATLHKGSELDTRAPGSSNLGNVSIEDVANIDITDDTKVLVATSETGGNTQVKETAKKTTKAQKGGKKKNQGEYDNLTPEQIAERLEAARRIVLRGY